MSVDSPEQLEALRRVGRLVAETLALLRAAVRPGISTGELDMMAAEFLTAHGARSGPILTYGYPGWTCISVEDEVVHGIPSDAAAAARAAGHARRRRRTGRLSRRRGDHRAGRDAIDRGRSRLVAATRAALSAGIRAALRARRCARWERPWSGAAREHGYRVFRELGGHGIGRHMHEPPTVLNWPAPDAASDQRLHAGLVLTIEPMLTAGRTRLVTEADGWTISALDGSPSAHEEHTIMVADGGPVVLTRR